MRKIYERCCVALMLIDNNVYTFISGILISLATNIFTTLCFEKFDIFGQWHLYISTVMYAISGAICILIATKTTAFQNYIYNKQILDLAEKRQIVIDVTKKDERKWIFRFALLFVSLISGTVLLAINYFIK